MEADDEMIVVIVGDGENEDLPSPIKSEVFDDDEVEKLIQTAATHGELVDVFVKEELEENEDNSEEWDDNYDEEYVPEGNDGEEYVPEGDDGEEYVPEGDDDEEYVPEGDDDEDDYNDDDGSDNETQNRHRHKMLKPAQRKSFVKELRDQYPELEDDSKALVTTLSEIMRNLKPPPPPQDYFIMNGIMFECVMCGTISETQSAAGRHYQEKHGERYLICFACGVDFRSTTNLYKHEKRCMAPDAVVVLKARAQVLGRKARSRPYIPKHIPKTNNLKKSYERKYSCSECPASFVSRSNFQSHEMLHRGVRPYVCSLCPCAYTSLAALSRHRKKHTDEQYICDHCGRAFKIKAALVTHMDTHLPVKRFGCAECENRYATKAALLRHVRRKHRKLPPPFLCKICFKRYPLISLLKEHTKKAHGLTLMTRKMFFKSLPTLTNTQIEQAKVVFKSEMEQDYSYTLQRLDDVPSTPVKVQLESSHEVPVELPVEVPVELPVEVPVESPDNEDPSLLMEHECKLEPVDEDVSNEQSIVLSEGVLQYVQSIQGGFEDGSKYNLVVIEDGEVLNLNYTEVPHELLSTGQLVLHNGEYLLTSET